MSFGLPPSTEVDRIIPKKTIIEKFSLSGKERAGLDSSIHRIVITNEISPRTVNIQPGNVKSIFVLRAELREEDCDPRILSMLFELIDQRMVIVLQCGIRCKPTVFSDMLIEGEWMLESDLSLTLEGLNLDEVWKNLVVRIGHIDAGDQDCLPDIVRRYEEHRRIDAEIAKLTKRMTSEKQPRKKRELFERIKKLKESIREPLRNGRNHSNLVSDDTTTSFPRTAVPYIRTSPFNPRKYSRSRIRCRAISDASPIVSSHALELILLNSMMM